MEPKFDGNKIFTSEEVLAGDEFIFDDHKMCTDHINYKLTEGEWGWVEFITGKYCIADYVRKNTVVDKNGDRIFTCYPDEMSKALDDDNAGWGKATMLGDDTALQMLFFLCYREDTDDESEEV